MSRTYCDYCSAELEISREFIYQMDSLNFVDDEFVLEAIRRTPVYHGEPLRLCKACHESIEKNLLSIKEESLDRQQDLRTCHRLFAAGALLLSTLLLFYCVQQKLD